MTPPATSAGWVRGSTWTRGQKRGVLIALVMLVIAVALAIRFWALGISDPSRYVASLDRLAFSPRWHLVRSEVKAPGADVGCLPIANLYCPSATRYYRVDSTNRMDIHAEVKQVVLAGGMQVEEEYLAACFAPNIFSDTCPFLAADGFQTVEFTIYDPGKDADSLGIADPLHSVVRVTARVRLLPMATKAPGG